jgi:hypothetical protein
VDFFHCHHCATSNWVIQVVIALLVLIAFNHCKSRDWLGLDGEEANESVNAHVVRQSQDICSRIEIRVYGTGCVASSLIKLSKLRAS